MPIILSAIVDTILLMSDDTPWPKTLVSEGPMGRSGYAESTLVLIELRLCVVLAWTATVAHLIRRHPWCLHGLLYSDMYLNCPPSLPGIVLHQHVSKTDKVLQDLVLQEKRLRQNVWSQWYDHRPRTQISWLLGRSTRHIHIILILLPIRIYHMRWATMLVDYKKKLGNRINEYLNRVRWTEISGFIIRLDY